MQRFLIIEGNKVFELPSHFWGDKFPVRSKNLFTRWDTMFVPVHQIVNLPGSDQ